MTIPKYSVYPLDEKHGVLEEEGIVRYVSGIYLHGVLDRYSNDIICAKYDSKLFNVLDEFKKSDKDTLRLFCDVCEEENDTCIMYIWKTSLGQIKGLIVDIINDEEGTNYASDMQRTKALTI